MGVKDYTGTLPAVRHCEMKKCDQCHTKKSAIPKKSTIPKGFIGVLGESTHAEVVPTSDTV